MTLALNILRTAGIGFSPVLKSLRLVGLYKDKDHDPRESWARKHFSYQYLRGKGLEIGALHKALPTRSTVEVRYVDRLSADDLRAQYPELKDLPIIDPDIVDNGETLETVEDESQDFIIANHFIEHCQDPIATIKNHLKKLRSGGILYYTIPHRDNTFDSNRPLTSVEHVVKDYKEGAEVSHIEHFKEFARLTKGVDPSELEAEVRSLMEKDYSIHFHVWTPKTFKELLEHMRTELNFPFEILEVAEWKYSKQEFVVILKPNSGSK